MISTAIRLRALAAGFELTANEEGFRERAYRNHVDEPWTIGFGFTYWPNGKKVQPTDRMTRPVATSFLVKQIEGRLNEVLSTIHDNVEPELTANMLTALLSLHHNLGHTQFKGSSVVRLINARNFAGAADAFLLWKRGNTANDLLPRRKRERKLFLTPDKKAEGGL